MGNVVIKPTKDCKTFFLTEFSGKHRPWFPVPILLNSAALAFNVKFVEKSIDVHLLIGLETSGLDIALLRFEL